MGILVNTRLADIPFVRCEKLLYSCKLRDGIDANIKAAEKEPEL